jgi:rhodanese-related sulfurtransferase
MNEYELDEIRLIRRERLSERAESQKKQGLAPRRELEDRTGASNVEKMLSAARARLRRLSPADAYEAMAKSGAILVDIRSEGQRAIEGNIPGAVVVERNVLEWRFDPASGSRLPIATDHGIQIIMFCSEGYTSSLAAAALQDLGLWRATDLVGGFHAWRATGLPVASPTPPS